jgi:hypothetical protein
VAASGAQEPAPPAFTVVVVGTGKYQIQFQAGTFAGGKPAVTATGAGSTPAFATVEEVGPETVLVEMHGAGGEAISAGFSFAAAQF